MWAMIKEANGRSVWIAQSLPLLLALPAVAIARRATGRAGVQLT